MKKGVNRDSSSRSTLLRKYSSMCFSLSNRKAERLLLSNRRKECILSVSGKFLVGARIKFWTLLGFFSKMVAPAGYPAKKLRIEEHPTENVDQTSQPRADDAAAQKVRQWSRALSQTLHVVCVSALGLAERPGEPHPRNIISLRSGEETRVISLGRGTRAIGAGGSKARVLKIWLRGIDPFAQSAICGH